MAYGQPHTALAPAVGTAGPGYATSVNAAIAELQATLAAKVTPAGMNLNAALSFLSGGTYSPITDLERLNFQNKSAALSGATYPRAIYVVNGDLVASLAGGITGSGYGASGVAVNWDAGSTSYQFKSGSGADAYAAIACDDLMLRDGSGNYWRLSSPALAGNLDFQLPGAYPGSTSLLQMSSAGVLTASNTVLALTATQGITCSVDQHVLVSGTGRFKHGNIERALPTIGFVHSGTAAFTAGVVNFGTTANSSTVYIPVSFDVGQRVRSVSFVLDNIAAGTAGTLTYTLLAAGGSVGSTATNSNADATVTISGIDHTVLTATSYMLQVSSSAGWDRDTKITNITALYDHP